MEIWAFTWNQPPPPRNIKAPQVVPPGAGPSRLSRIPAALVVSWRIACRRGAWSAGADKDERFSQAL